MAFEKDPERKRNEPKQGEIRRKRKPSLLEESTYPNKSKQVVGAVESKRIELIGWRRPRLGHGPMLLKP